MHTLFRRATGRPALQAFAIFMAIYAAYSIHIVFVRILALLIPISRFIDPLSLDITLGIGGVALSAMLGFFMLLMVGSSIIDSLKLQSITDPMTGRLNRRGIDQKIAEELTQSARGSYIFSVAVIDLDYFKAINDRFGHSVGDDALRHVADVMLATVRPYDCLGRVGGDEFVLIMPTTEGMHALTLAGRICEEIRSANLDDRLHLSVSIGTAQYEFTDTAASLFTRADMALYQAKEAGRGCARFQSLPVPNANQSV